MIINGFIYFIAGIAFILVGYSLYKFIRNYRKAAGINIRVEDRDEKNYSQEDLLLNEAKADLLAYLDRKYETCKLRAKNNYASKFKFIIWTEKTEELNLCFSIYVQVIVEGQIGDYQLSIESTGYEAGITQKYSSEEEIENAIEILKEMKRVNKELLDLKGVQKEELVRDTALEAL